MDLQNTWNNAFEEAEKTLHTFHTNKENMDKCIRFSNLLIDCFKKGNNVFSCGNGGSHCDSMHFAEELTGQFRKPRKPLGALALGDPSHMTCTANDYGFEYIFARQLEGLGRKGDVLIALSTSGNSQNVINAVKVAKQKGIKVVGLLGKTGGKLKDLVDIPIIVQAQTSDRIQEVHIKIIHTVIESVERELFKENYEQA